MRVLVVTPTLGLSPWLAETVASVARQTIACRHVLVAPAGRVDELASRFPALHIAAEPAGGRGMYAAINAGVAAESGWDYVTYLNDDDVLLPAFSDAVSRLPSAPGQSCLGYGRVRLIGPNGRRLGGIPISPHPALNRALYAQRLEPVYQHGTLISRAAWNQLKGFDERFRFCGDSELLARACVQRIRFVRCGGREIAAFRLRGGQLTKNRAAMQAERGAVDAKLGLLVEAPRLSQSFARLIFRVANLPVYCERVARHGFITFDELLTRAG